MNEHGNLEKLLNWYIESSEMEGLGRSANSVMILNSLRRALRTLDANPSTLFCIECAKQDSWRSLAAGLKSRLRDMSYELSAHRAELVKSNAKCLSLREELTEALNERNELRAENELLRRRSIAKAAGRE